MVSHLAPFSETWFTIFCGLQNWGKLQHTKKKSDYLVYRFIGECGVNTSHLFKVKGNDLVVRCKMRVSLIYYLMTNFSHSNFTYLIFFLIICAS